MLRAQFTKCSATEYRADFSGRFFKILPFKYSLTLDVIDEDGETLTLAGKAFLGRMFGAFCYEATADSCRFTAHYTSKKDVGRFDLTRTAP